MRLFKIKLTYLDGARSHPWTVFASSFGSALSSLESVGATSEILRADIQEVFRPEAGYWGRDYDKPNNQIEEHRDIQWVAG